MKGTHRVIVSNTTVKYEFDIKRNITVIKGDSASGKTTLVEMMSEFYESGVIKNVINLDVLNNPSKYIESSEYFSWERFFTKYLTDITGGTYLKYNKQQINPVYLHESNKKAILDVMDKVNID